MKHTKMILLSVAMFSMAGSFAQTKTGLHVTNTFYIKSAGGWDYLEAGPINDWLYVSHGSQVNILNKKTGDSVGVIENTTGIHGIAFDEALGRGYTSNGRLNNVFVFDMNTNKVLATIATGQNPDAIMYEPFSKKIITCNGRSNNLSIIDPALNKTIDSIAVGGKPETAVSDGAGKIFVNIEDKNEIVAIDATTFKVIGRWSITPAEGPTGLAYDKVTKRLFAGCEKMLAVVDATTGKVVATPVIGDGCDGVAFDAAKNNIYTSNGEGTVTVVHEDGPDKYTVVENIVSKRGARTIAIDKAGTLYLPTADFEAMQPGEKGRPKMKAGTFQVVVIGK